MALFIVERVGTGFTVRSGENAMQAAASALAAAQSAAYAGGFETPEYASQAAGESATTEGAIFRVPLGTTPQTFAWYRRKASGSEAVSPLATTAALAASGGSALVGFLQSGTGGTARTVQAKLRDTVSVKDFGAVGDGVADDTAAIQAAFNYAAIIGGLCVHLPTGNYRTTATITCGGIGLVGEGSGSRIRPEITDGSPALVFSAGSNYFRLENVTVWSDIVGTYRNCIGVQIGGTVGSASYANRYQIKNVLVHGVKVGATVNGFLGEIDIFVQFCETGVNGNQVNAAQARLKIENCVNAGNFTDCVGTNFHVIYEGGASLVNGFNWDACHGCSWLAPYVETANTTVSLNYLMRFGGTSECQGVKIVGGATFGYGILDAYWIFDRVHGLDVDQHWITSNMVSSLGRHMRTTTNTKRIRNLGFRFSNASGAWLTDNSLSARAYKNLVCNSDFRAGFKGFRAVGTVSSAVMAVETATTRGSGTAVRITSPAGATGANGGFFRLPDALRDAYKGKKLWLGVWLYVPDIAEYSSLTNKSPAIALNDGVGATLSAGGYLRKGAWNFVHVERTINAGATELVLFAYPMNYVSGGYTATGNEHVIVGEIFVIDGATEVDPARVVSGGVFESGGGGHVIGSNVVIPGTAAPTGSLQQWTQGDRVVNVAATVGQPKAWVCTVSGAPGTWVSEGVL